MQAGDGLETFERADSTEMIEQIFDYVTRISGEKSPYGIVSQLAEMARAITYADRCTVWLMSQDKKELWTYVAQGIDEIRVPAQSGIVGYAVTEGKRMIVNDVYGDARFNAEIDQQTGYRTETMMVVPMFCQNGDIAGAFQLINKLPKGARFQEDDFKYIMLASTYAAETIASSIMVKDECDG